MMNFEKPLLSALSRQTSKKIPVWFMRQAGRYLPEYQVLRKKEKNFIQFCLTPDLAVEATLQPLKRFDLDAGILFSDILIIPYALGMKISFKENEGPILENIEDKKSFLNLNKNSCSEIFSPVGETVSTLTSFFSGIEKSLIGFAGSPWTVACYMVEGRAKRDFPKTRLLSVTNPVFFQEIINLLIEVTIDYLCMQIEKGVEVVQLFDSWAGLLSGEEFDRWVIEPTQKIVVGVKKKYPNISIIGFPKGANLLYHDYATKTGVTAISFDSQISLNWISGKIHPICPIQGNLDPVFLKAGGKIMEEKAEEILSVFGKKPGFIFNLGHGIDKNTPISHLTRLIEVIRDFERREL